MTERKQIITPEWRKPVIAVPLTQAFPELGEVKEFKSKVCLFSHDRKKVFDVVSDKYHVIDHGQALDVVLDGIKDYFSDDKLEANVRSMNGGARIFASVKIPVPNVQVKKGDLTAMSITIRNSYDRSMPFLATLSGLRLICTNGMTAGTAFGSIRARHVGNADAEARDEELHTNLDTMVKSIPELREVWRQWADTKVTIEEAHALLSGKFPGKYLNPVLDASRFPRSKWDLYNDLTRFATHDTKSIQRRLEFDDLIARLFYGSDTAE